jgi:sn-glycerol 3-phosphate transport system ATP-binding protein/multiple sugar transport system ATP-binding protein
MAKVLVSGLNKQFGQTHVLKGVDVAIPDGAFAVLVGPSGCGKSTLLRVLAGLEQADAGTIHFGDREVTRLEPRERDIAMVFQSYALYPHLSVRDNLGFGLKLRKADPAEIARRVAEASDMLGLGPLLDRLPKQLSGGQRQRVAMGRAIVRRPQLFLFDEPLSNLDAALRSQVRVDIRKLHDRLGATSIYVTHDQVEAMTLADVMFVLNKGVVEQSGAPLDIYARPATASWRRTAAAWWSPPRAACAPPSTPRASATRSPRAERSRWACGRTTCGSPRRGRGRPWRSPSSRPWGWSPSPTASWAAPASWPASRPTPA